MRLGGCLAALGCAGAACAGPTALNWYPVADALKAREVAVSQLIYGTERHIDPRWYPYWTVQAGLGHGLEAGIDHDYLGGTLGNVKWNLLEDDGRYPNLAFSVGAMNWSGKDVDPYAVGRYDGHGYRLHAGWIREGGVSRVMGGVDFPIGESWTGMVDGASGPGAVWWIGAYGSIDAVPGLGIWVGAGFPARRSEGTRFGAGLGYSFRL